MTLVLFIHTYIYTYIHIYIYIIPTGNILIKKDDDFFTCIL